MNGIYEYLIMNTIIVDSMSHLSTSATHTMQYSSISLNNSCERYMYMCGKLVMFLMFFYSYTTVHVSHWTIDYTYMYVNLIMNTIIDDSSRQYVSLVNISYTYH